MPTDCIVCFKSVPTDGCFMKCVSCNHAYHLEKCSGVAPATFKSMGNAKREKWNCRTCRNRESRLSVGGSCDSGTPANDDTVSSQLADISAKLELLFSLKANVDRLCDLPAKVDDLLSLKTSMDAMRETICALQASMEKYESIVALVTENDKEVKLLRTEVERLQGTVSGQTELIENLQTNINATEQYSRRCNLEIHGVPVSTDEDLSVTLNGLASKLNLAIPTPAEVVACHRLRSRRDGAPPILVQFASVSVKEHWMKARKNLVRLVRSQGEPKIYFNDNLTSTNKDLFWRARTRGKEKSYRFVWVKNGTIFAKKDENATLVRVSSARDLEKII